MTTIVQRRATSAATQGERHSADAAARRPSRRGHLLSGTVAVALGVAAGRWGAYLGLPPVFVTDVLLFLAFAGMLVGFALHRTGPRPAPSSSRGWPGAVLVLLLGYALGRWLVGQDHSLVSLRDFAPYGYAAVAFLAAAAAHRSTPQDRQRTLRVLEWALYFRLTWVAVACWLPEVAALGPMIDADQGVQAFSLRSGSDGTVVGVAAALAGYRYLNGGKPRHAVLALVALAVTASLPTRAALLSTVVAVVIVAAVYLLSGARARRTGPRRLLVLGVVPGALIAAVVILPQTSAGSRLVFGTGLLQAQTDIAAQGAGTRRARELAWTAVIHHVDDEHVTIQGVGFGTDYLFDSGGRAALSTADTLRAPHNFLVGTYARLGLIGLLLFLLVVAMAAREAIRSRRQLARDRLLLTVVTLPAALLTSALFGVELESPFVAVPFFWCVGVLLSRPTWNDEDAEPGPGSHPRPAPTGRGRAPS